jgi:bifunctional DNA-binding transcriptional regulator/antitoxin component of YhaV-PrlF toxin-antitoxin module
MGYVTKVQVIERQNRTRQFYVILPAPLAEALEVQKGEEVEWVVEDKVRLTVRRLGPARRRART